MTLENSELAVINESDECRENGSIATETQTMKLAETSEVTLRTNKGLLGRDQHGRWAGDALFNYPFREGRHHEER